MKKSVLLSVLVIGFCLIFAAASLAAELVSETRDVETFHSVKMSGAGNLYITQGESIGLRVEAKQSVLDKLLTHVEGGVLVIEKKKIWSGRGKINAYVTMIEVKRLTLSGSVKLIGQTPVVSESLTLKVAGSGQIDLEVDVQKLSTSISGSGEANLRGRAMAHDFKASGSGKLDGFELATEKTKIVLSGSGKAEILVSQEVDVKISGSGKVFLKGEGKVGDLKISGSGIVKRVD